MSNRYALRFVVAFVVVAVGVVSTPAARVAAGGADILDRIRGVAGVVSVEEAGSSVPGTRFFRAEFEQPVDHANPTGPTFRQRLTILHRDVNAPTVLEINGYYVNPNPVQYELTALFQANQIHVEHRYFAPSRPDPVDWQFLNIAESAADHHEIVHALKTIYTAKWVSTGASKGGMASVYFRYFYPDDVDATVPYVAPSSHGTQDPRYVAFVAGLGTAKCQRKLVAFQRRALKKRAKLMRYMRDASYDVLGKDRALEFAILEMPFIFWQYNDANLCDEIPGAGASAREIYDFLDRVVSVQSYGDGFLTAFEPYFYQSATQLGGPAVGEVGLEDLLHYPGQDAPDILPPLGVPKAFDASVMPLVERFVLDDAERMLFVYGANDPWSTNAFGVSAENDSYRLFVTGLAGNHGSQILELPDADRDFALGKIGEWLDAPRARASAAQLSSDPRYRIDRPTRQELFLR
jgi:hypothetical protein